MASAADGNRPPSRGSAPAAESAGARFERSRPPNRSRLPAPLADGLAVAVLAALCLTASWLTWGRMYDPILDQGWYMQVAARVLSGEVLYRDVVWMYPPLSIYLLAWLFGALGIAPTALLLLQHLLAAMGCVLTYCIARHLLPRPLALLGTVAVFSGGWWGGFVGYAFAYTGSVPLGAVLGLAMLASLLAYVRRGRSVWLAVAGLATGAALLTKPEFALACLGTGLVFLGALLLYPAGLARTRREALRALGGYLVPAVAVAGAGYGVAIAQAGWSALWAGVSGYDQDAILLQAWPIWGTPRSWGALASGLGLYVLAAVLLAGVLAPGAVRRRGRWAVGVAWVGLGLAVMPWVLLVVQPAPLSSFTFSAQAALEEALRLLWAPATLLSTAALLLVVRRWIWARRHGEPLAPAAWSLGLLALYSILPAARSYLHPLGTFHFQHLDALWPLLLFAGLVLLPWLLEQRWQVRVHRLRAIGLVVLFLGAYTLAGLAWSAGFVSQMRTELESPRGLVRYQGDTPRRQPWPELLAYVLARTEPGAAIAILGPEPGTYFWSARRNPLRQDSLLPRMASSREDAREIVRRLDVERPSLVIVSQSVRTGRGWFWDLPVGRESYAALAPVWEYVAGHYQLASHIGDQEWGYAVYQPSAASP